MKKIAYLIAGLFAFGVSSCSDMLDVDSSSELFEPDMNHKTDSVFYTFGVMTAMQQLADIYVLQNEMRGDLVSPAQFADINLKKLADYSADGTNAYDSAYVYYRVINNVNYYLAHRDTTLADGSTNLVTNEYGAMLAFRAWAYLQAVRQYGTVKYITHPLTAISDIENDNSPRYDIYQLASALIPELEKYSGLSVPSYGNINCGTGNNSHVASKTVSSYQSFIPVDVILGELYLERGQEGDYMLAAQHFYKYLDNNAAKMYLMSLTGGTLSDWFFRGNYSRPSDFPTTGGTIYPWASNIFSNQNTLIVSQIPMAQNYMYGTTTKLPLLYGFDYYTANDDSVYATQPQIVPSRNYYAIADSTDCYYASSTDLTGLTINSFRGTDLRRYGSFDDEVIVADTATERMLKFRDANVILYRNSTIWLRFAEALNRAGYPDAAFAVLKDGLKSSIIGNTRYLTPETETLLTTVLPVCSPSNINSEHYMKNVGIHSWGASYMESVATSTGAPNGPLGGTHSPYQMDTIVGLKIAQIARDFNVPMTYTKADIINAVEDLICDEYAMEFAFEGTRYSDLTRLARRKNRENTSYGSNFGGLWFARKMAFKNPAKDLSIESNWYLPWN